MSSQLVKADSHPAMCHPINFQRAGALITEDRGGTVGGCHLKVQARRKRAQHQVARLNFNRLLFKISAVAKGPRHLWHKQFELQGIPALQRLPALEDSSPQERAHRMVCAPVDGGGFNGTVGGALRNLRSTVRNRHFEAISGRQRVLAQMEQFCVMRRDAIALNQKWLAVGGQIAAGDFDRVALVRGAFFSPRQGYPRARIVEREYQGLCCESERTRSERGRQRQAVSNQCSFHGAQAIMSKSTGHYQEERPIVLVGGGLANILIALRLDQSHPQRPWRLLERGPELGGEHTWSFHTSDAANTAWLRAFATCEWPGYEVRFPNYIRKLQLPYAAIRSRDLAARLQPMWASRVRLNCEVAQLAPDHVILATGERLEASLVIDGRGFPAGGGASGWQTFFGLFVRTAAPHGLREPTLMDATIDQGEAYRFIYVLPWSDDCLLIEDTRYADSPERDEAASARGIEAYAQSRGWRIAEVLERESAALPIPCGDELTPHLPADGIIRSGVRAGLYHVTTGYSLEQAVGFANELVAHLERPDLGEHLRNYARRQWQRGAFLRRLNAMMFRAAEPGRRWQVMQQFYRRDPRLIARFYGMDLKTWDYFRLVSGIPPVPFGRGLVAFLKPNGGLKHVTTSG